MEHFFSLLAINQLKTFRNRSLNASQDILYLCDMRGPVVFASVVADRQHQTQQPAGRFF